MAQWLGMRLCSLTTRVQFLELTGDAQGFSPFIEDQVWCVVEPLMKKYLDTHLKSFEDHVYLGTHTKMAVCIPSWCRGWGSKILPHLVCIRDDWVARPSRRLSEATRGFPTLAPPPPFPTPPSTPLPPEVRPRLARASSMMAAAGIWLLCISWRA